MKRLLPLFAAALFIFAATMGDAPVKKITVTGHLVDTKCYGMGTAMGKPGMNYGNDHMIKKGDKMMKVPNCATACASMGIPVGIVDGSKPGNKTYIIITSATALKDHMDQEARVTGEEAFPGSIIAGKVEVKVDGKWKDVTPGAMM